MKRMEPIFPQSIWISVPWAGQRLSSVCGKKSTEGKNFGIRRDVCTYPGSENRVMHKPFAGQTLRQLIDSHHAEIMGGDARDQLLRVAYLDTAEALSVQVHPDEQSAAEIGDYEKSEAWYIVDCAPGAYLYAGTTIEDKRMLRQSIMDRTIEKYLKKIPVRPGDCVTIPAGLIHACGANMLAVEAGTFGGKTYRLWDFGRQRTLDIERGLASAHLELRPEIRHAPPGLRAKNARYAAVRHPMFQVDILDVAREWTQSIHEYHILSFVDGNCTLRTARHQYPLHWTDSVLLPASLPNFTLKGDCRMIDVSCCGG